MKQSVLIGKTFSNESSTEIISLDDIKEHLYIDLGNTDFDSVLTNLRKEVRQFIEETCCISLVSRTVTAYIDYNSSFTIPWGPVIDFSSASIKTGIGQYEVETEDDDFEIEVGKFISYTGFWRYKLVYDAGYTSVTLPHGLKMAFLNEVARRFDKRGDRDIPESNDLLEPYKNLEWLV